MGEAGKIPPRIPPKYEAVATMFRAVKGVAFTLAAGAGSVALYGALVPEGIFSKTTAAGAAIVFLASGTVGIGSWCGEKMTEAVGRASGR